MPHVCANAQSRRTRLRARSCDRVRHRTNRFIIACADLRKIALEGALRRSSRKYFFSRIRLATFLLLDYGVTSAATARQAFTFRERRSERILTRTLKSLHQSNHYQPSLHTARGATSHVIYSGGITCNPCARASASASRRTLLRKPSS